MVDKPIEPNSINIELGEKEAEGIYSNFVIVVHSASEFVIDFAKIMPGMPKGKVNARILMTPQHAKSLANTLNDNIGKYERSYGTIKMPNQKGNSNDWFDDFQMPSSDD